MFESGALCRTHASPVGVSGVIRDLDTASRSFTLLLTSSTSTFARGESRLVRADETTQVTVKGSPARFAALSPHRCAW